MSSEITKSPYKSLYFQYSEKRKDCEELISLFDALYDLEISHSHSLEKIADQIRESKNSSCLKEILDAFCKYMTNKAHQSQQMSENLVSDIISPLKNTAKSYNSIMKKISLECNRLLKKKQKLIDETSTAKNKYWKICGSCESDLLSLDLSIDQNKIIVNRSKKDVEKYLKIYLDLVENCNRVISSFNESSKKFREDYQTESQILLENFKDSFRKFVVYDTSCVRNIQYDLETFSQMVQSCELEVLRKIVIDSAKELIYEPFQSNHPFFKSLSSNDVQFPASLEGLSKIGTLYKRDLDKILNKAYQGIKLNSSDYQQFNCIIKETMGRKCWCLCLNSYKNKGSVQLPDQGFLQISELSLSFLNECEREVDLSALKDCVFLSSVFFKENPFKKQLLRDAISSHSIFENIDVWHSLITFSIESEMKESQKYLKTEAISHVENVVFCQLGSYCDIMQGFNIKFSKIKRLIQQEAKKYKIPKADLEILLANVDPKLSQSLEQEKSKEVLRGIPSWLKVIESAAVSLSKRGAPKTILKISPNSSSRSINSPFEDRRSL